MTQKKPPAPELKTIRPSPMHAEMADFSLRRFFSILFYRRKKPGK
jgi:hypothetical protein